MSQARASRDQFFSSAQPHSERWMVVVGIILSISLVGGCGGPDPASSAEVTSAVPSSESPADVGSVGSVASASAGLPAPGQVARATEPDAVFAGVLVSWDVSGDYLLVTTYGSSSCPNTIDRVVKAGDQRLEFFTGDDAAQTQDSTAPRTCTADLAPFTSSVVVPTGTVRTEPLTVVFQGTEIVVPAQT